MIEKYDKLRTDLIDISDRLQYKSGKLGYLSGLQQTLSEIVGVRSTTIDTQLNQIYDSDEEVSTQTIMKRVFNLVHIAHEQIYKVKSIALEC